MVGKGFQLTLKKNSNCKISRVRGKERYKGGKELRLRSSRSSLLHVVVPKYQSSYKLWQVMNGPCRLHWSTRCRRIISSLPVNYRIIVKANRNQRNAGSLHSYPPGQNIHLGGKVVLHLPPQLFSSNKSISISGNLHRAICASYFCELQLVRL